MNGKAGTLEPAACLSADRFPAVSFAIHAPHQCTAETAGSIAHPKRTGSRNFRFRQGASAEHTLVPHLIPRLIGTLVLLHPLNLLLVWDEWDEWDTGDEGAGDKVCLGPLV